MEDLRSVMQVIDQNAHILPEGDYLKLCNLMRKLYTNTSQKSMQTIVDYETFDISTLHESDEVLDHFHDYFYNESLMNEECFIGSQIEYLLRELEYNKPMKRITKHVKTTAIIQYCSLHGIHLDTYDEDTLRQRMDERGCDIGDSGTKFEKGVQKLYRSYMALENTYRSMYRAALNRRICELRAWIEDLSQT